MASRKSIISSAKHIPGGARPTPAPQSSGPNFGQISPLAQQLDTGGSAGQSWARAYGGFLPRPTQDFTQGAFGPFSPILPVPVDAPPAPDAPRPEPRLWQYEVGYNLPVGAPGSEGYKLADFGTLKTLADLYSVARACIQLRKAEIRGLAWDITPTRDAAKAMRGSHAQMKDFGQRRAEAVKFFRRPDPDFFSWNSWLDALLEEVFVFDALSLLLRPKWARGRGKGLLGSDLDSLQLISGPTIRPLVDLHGATPRPPAVAYEQYLYGVPRVDLMTMITQRDIEENGLTGTQVQEYRGDQLLYLPMVPRRETKYGFPPIERALIPVMSGLQKQGYQLDFYREGTVPAVYISPGGVNSNMTPNQLRELQDALNAIAGDPAWKHKIIVLPADSRVEPQRPPQLADQFDEIVMNQVCCVPGTEVLTKRGLVNIEDIEIGDEVLTHKNRWRPVLAKFKNERGDHQIHKITARGFDALEVTDNHKIWSARKGQTASRKSFLKEFGWVPAGEIKAKRSRGDFDNLTLPALSFPESVPTLDVHSLIGHEFEARAKKINPQVAMDRDFGRMVGFYMAEGSSTNGQLFWAFNRSEKEYQEQVADALDKLFGLKASVLDKAGTKVTNVQVQSVMLSALLSCGVATNKVLPEWVWAGGREFFEGLLEGWVNGDGCKTSNGFRGYTASKSLAWQMRLVAASLGYAAGVRTQKQPEISFGGREMGGQGYIYVVQWVTDSKKPNSYKLEEGHLTSAVQSNELSEHTGDVVWNLNVQEDHSYLTTGGEVKNCMAFDIQPMELGIMPKVSTTVSPGAGNQMAKATAGIHERKATKPTLQFLADIMNGILRDVCHQDDMQFTFEGLEEDEDEQTQTALLAQQIQVGLASIDEGREALGRQPWGLPETSDPGWATASGFVPLGQVTPSGEVAAGPQPTAQAPAGAAGQQPSGQAQGAADGKPAKPTGSDGNAGQTPGHTAAESATTASKAARPVHPKATAHQDRREQHVTRAKDTVVDRLKGVTDAYQRGDLNLLTALDTGVAALADGYRHVMTAAATDARHDHGLRKPRPAVAKADDGLDEGDYVDEGDSTYDEAAISSDATSRAETQRSFLIGLLKAIAAGITTAALAARLDLYGNTLNGAYNAAYGTTLQQAPGDYEITWRLGAAEHCKLCVDRDGKTYTFHSLPGWPGDGGFGGAGAVCLGGPLCHCSLEYRQLGVPVTIGGNVQRDEAVGYYQQQLTDIIARRQAAEQAREDFLASIPDAPAARAHTRDSIRQELADLANERIRATGGYPGVSVEPADIPAAEVAARTPAHMKARAICAELEALARHVRKGRLISTWQPRHISQQLLARVAENMARGLLVDDAIEVAKATRRVELNGQEVWQDQPASGQVPMYDVPAGGGGRVFPAHTVDGIEVPGGTPGISAGGEPPRWAPPEGTSSGDTFSAPNRRTVAAPDDADDGMWPRGGHGTTQAPVTGMPGSRKSASDLTDPNPVEAVHVRNLMLDNFPPQALAWVDDARWIGPVQVPLDRVDWDDADSWAASHQGKRVKQFAKRIKNGDIPHPAIGVQTVGDDKVKIVDGHHRALAYRKLNRPIVAYVGFVPDGDDRWEETHSYQQHQGDNPANKEAKLVAVSRDQVDQIFRTVLPNWLPVAAGLAVRAADTGRVLMLQRAISDDDPAAGKWEFPGGCLEPGEIPIQAATREWQEETGCTLPTGQITGQWTASNGRYAGFVYQVASEQDVPIGDGRDQVINPDDPDGDLFEALAWWSLNELADNPAIRPELAADLGMVLEALAGE